MKYSFKPIQSWEKGSTTTDMISLKQVSSLAIEVVESKPYGIEVPIDEVLNIETEDLFRDMCERQVDYVSPQTYNPNASYIPYRRHLVDWMSDIGDQCHLHNTTVHVATLYLDKILRCRKIPQSRWFLLATACLSVAGKYEEAEENCPSIPELLHITNLDATGYHPLSFREAEVEVLRYLGWRLRAVPPLHIANYFLAKGATFVDDLYQGQCIFEKIPKYVKKYVDFFCSLTMQHYSFQQYLPSQLAAAILLATRVALQMKPRWRPELTRLTGYEEHEIVETFHHVFSYYRQQHPSHYCSRSMSPKSVAKENIYE